MPIPKGTRDYTPQRFNKRNFIQKKLSEVFSLFGFESIETPAMENTQTLLGKYGDEGERLIFRILNSGNFLSGTNPHELSIENADVLRGKISEKALRYDLTVPFARFVIDNFNDLTFPFRRSQIQNVWRADRPQKGRYREFIQADVDIIGTHSLLADTELIELVWEAFQILKLDDIHIHINNRNILFGLAEVIGLSERVADMTVSIDRIDKIGKNGVLEDLKKKNFSEEQCEIIKTFLHFRGSNEAILEQLIHFFKEKSTQGIQGVEALKETLKHSTGSGKNTPVKIDTTLARGLNYYTGIIIEVHHADFDSSIGGGGRYDNLTALFGKQKLPGVGISFGVDRIYDLMEKLDLFPEFLTKSTDVLVLNMGEKAQKKNLEMLSKLRKWGISSEMYYEPIGLKKQFRYADNKKIPFVFIIGEDEIKKNTITIKNMVIGEQSEIKIDEKAIKELINS